MEFYSPVWYAIAYPWLARLRDGRFGWIYTAARENVSRVKPIGLTKPDDAGYKKHHAGVECAREARARANGLNRREDET